MDLCVYIKLQYWNIHCKAQANKLIQYQVKIPSYRLFQNQIY